MLFISTIAVTAAAPKSPADNKVDQFIRARMSADHIPGLSIAVVKSGKIVYATGYGKASLELNVAPTASTIYPIASLSKQFCAAGVMSLVQDGKLKLDVPFVPLLPKLKLPATWSAITVRELLNQTSGLPAYTEFANIDPNKDAMLKTYSAQDVVNLIAAKPLAFVPGTQFEYSNTNYFLLAQVVAAVSGKDFYQFLKQQLFLPLKMNSTAEYDQTVVVPGRADRYIWTGGQFYDNFLDTDPSFRVGAGGIESSVLDLAKWDAALYSNSPLSEASKNAMWTAPKLQKAPALDYGFGWALSHVNGHRLIWHNGALPGAMCWMGRFVDDKLTIIFLTNSLDLDHVGAMTGEFQQIGEHIAGIYEPALMPKKRSDTPDSTASKADPKLVALSNKALEDIASGHADPTMYSSAAAAVLFPSGIAATKALFNSLGDMQGFTVLGFRQATSNEVVLRGRVVFGTQPITYDFYFDKSDKITGILPEKPE